MSIISLFLSSESFHLLVYCLIASALKSTAYDKAKASINWYPSAYQTLQRSDSSVDKSAYLDAMGISRWSQGEEGKQAYTILVDKVSSELDNHPIIATVLSLIDCPFTHCTFSSSLVKGADVIWDMRRIKLPKSSATLTSSPLKELEKTAESKRELWLLITAYQEAEQ